MSNKLFIIVQEVKTSQHYSDTEMLTRASEREVITHIGRVSSAEVTEDDVRITRIFTVDEYGRVTHYDTLFKDGRFQLEVIPDVK